MRLRVLTAAALVVAAAVCAVPGVATGLLFLAPALLLAVPLLAGRYVGERAVARLVAARARPRRSRGAARRTPGLPAAPFPRGGQLIAWSLAVRPPPAAGRL